MQKSLLTFLVAFTAVLTVILTSCTRQNQAPSQSVQIVGKWTMKSAIGSYTVLGSNRKDTTNFTPADYFNFKADGTVAIMESSEGYNGNWKITNNKLIFTNTQYVDFDGGFDIVTLNTNTLKIRYYKADANSTVDQTLILSR